MRQVDKVLYYASRTGDLNRVERAIKKGADVNATNDDRRGETPLHEACEYGRDAVVLFLLGNGADVDAKATSFGLHERTRSFHYCWKMVPT